MVRVYVRLSIGMSVHAGLAPREHFTRTYVEFVLKAAFVFCFELPLCDLFRLRWWFAWVSVVFRGRSMRSSITISLYTRIRIKRRV